MISIPSTSAESFRTAIAAAIAPAGGQAHAGYYTGVHVDALERLAREFVKTGGMTALPAPFDGQESDLVQESEFVTWVDVPAQAPVETLPDISGLSVDGLRRLQAAIKGRITEMSEDSLVIWTGDDGDVADCPKGGVILRQRWAAGGRHDMDEWYPSLQAAKAALLDLAKANGRTPSPNGCYVDLTREGCHSSGAWIV